MKTTLPEGARLPTFGEAMISLLSLIAGISVSIIVYGLDPHIPMLLGVAVASAVALRCKFPWQSIQNGMVRGITNALPAVIILIVVGILIGVWILAGVVPTLIYYGLQVLSPGIFLPATVIICSIASLATGTSWGTSGTIGVALIGIGASLGFPLPLVAGAVLSGAYFGDKMSPLSDTTNMAPALVGTDLFTHIKHMSYTSGVAIILTLIIEYFIGLSYGGNSPENLERVQTMLTTLDANFTINPVLLIPPLVVAFVSYKKVPAIPGITLGVIAAAFCAIGLQGSGYEDLINASFSGFEADTGVEDVDNLLSRGGMDSMMWTIGLVISALMFGGVMERTSQLKVIADKIMTMAKSNGSLILATALTTFGANVVMAEQYMSIVVGARTFAPEYRRRGLAPENLSRVVEDAGTVTANLVPWSSGGAYQTATLGVPTIAYAPFAFFCWLSPLVTILFGYTGWTIKKMNDEELAEVKAEEAEAAASA